MADSEEKLTDQQRQQRILLIAALAIIVGMSLRLRLMGLTHRALEYDEIWTYMFYSQDSFLEIFKNLATPNNHTIHTLLVSWSTMLLGDNFLAIRFPALFMSLLAIAGFGLLLWQFDKGNYALFFLALACIGLDGWQAHYGQTARGYSMQSCFFVYYLLGIFYAEKSGMLQKLGFVLIATMPLLAFVLLPSSLLFLIPIALCHVGFLIYRAKQKDGKCLLKQRGILIAYAVTGIFSALGLWHGLEMFQEGRAQFAVNLESVKDGLFFIISTLGKIIPWPFYVIVVAAAIFSKRYRLHALAAIAVVFGSMLLSVLLAAGPPRVSLPLQIPLYAAASLAIVEFAEAMKSKFKQASVLIPSLGVLVLLIYAPLSTAEQTPPDWQELHAKAEELIPARACIVYDPAVTYEIAFDQAKEVIARHDARLPSEDTVLYSVGNKQLIGVSLGEGKERSFELPEKASDRKALNNRLSAYGYVLVKVSDFDKADFEKANDLCIVSIQPRLADDYNNLLRVFTERYQGEWYKLNSFLAGDSLPTHEQEKTLGILLVAEGPSMPSHIMQKIHERSQGQVSFFRIAAEGASR